MGETSSPHSPPTPLYKLLGMSKSGSFKGLCRSLVKRCRLDVFSPKSKNDDERLCSLFRETNDASKVTSNDEKAPEKPVKPIVRSSSGACPNRFSVTKAESSRPSLLEKSRSTNYSVRRCLPPLVFTASTITRKPPPVEMIVECTLEELFRGRVKRIKIVRDVIKNGIYMQEEETVKIKLTPGWKSGTKITFEGKPANEDDKQRCNASLIPTDVILVIQEKPHHLFSRDGDNLVYDVDIPLTDALAGCTLSVPMLSKDNMWLSFADDEVIYPGYEKVIRGQGMPVPDEKGKKGDFVIRFSVIFPTELSSERRRKACEILQECCWECPLT